MAARLVRYCSGGTARPFVGHERDEGQVGRPGADVLEGRVRGAVGVPVGGGGHGDPEIAQRDAGAGLEADAGDGAVAARTGHGEFDDVGAGVQVRDREGVDGQAGAALSLDGDGAAAVDGDRERSRVGGVDHSDGVRRGLVGRHGHRDPVTGSW
jgi:hypothetical protein